MQLVSFASITGGLLSTSAGGVIRVNSNQSAFLTDLTNAGTFIGNDNTITHIAGTITNNGTMTFNSVGNLSDLRFDADTTLAGSGTVFLTSATSRIYGIDNTVRLTIASGQTISGLGQIGVNQGLITNQGLIDANISGQSLTMSQGSATNSFLNQSTILPSQRSVRVLTPAGRGVPPRPHWNDLTWHRVRLRRTVPTDRLRSRADSRGGWQAGGSRSGSRGETPDATSGAAP